MQNRQDGVPKITNIASVTLILILKHTKYGRDQVQEKEIFFPSLSIYILKCPYHSQVYIPESDMDNIEPVLVDHLPQTHDQRGSHEM